jgi:hypothetical protein
MSAYGSDPFSYDHEAHLRLNAMKLEPTKPPAVGSANARYWQQFVAPTSEALHRHATRFGLEFVKATAEAFGIYLRNVAAVPKSTEKKTRRTTETLRAKVLNLHERGVVPAAIADTLNVSDRRVAQILRAA